MTADHQPEPRPARFLRAGVDLGKGAEQAFLIADGNADAGVFNLHIESQPLAVLRSSGPYAQAHLTGIGELDGVAQQVGQNLSETQRINQYVEVDFGVQLGTHLYPFLLRHALKHAHGGLHQRHQLRALLVERHSSGFDLRDVQNVSDQLKQAVCGFGSHIDGRFVRHALFGFFHGQLQHADHGVHRCADLVAHGGQKITFGQVRLVGMVLRFFELFDQLLALTDVDPTADDAHDRTIAAAVGQHPVINGQHLAVGQGQRMITQHRAPLLHHLQVVGVVNPALVFGVEGGLQQVFADHGFAAHTKGLQIHLIANQQASLAVAHIDRVRRAVDQGAHERQLVIEGTLGLIAFLHQPPQVGNPHHPHSQHAQQH